MAEKAEGSLSSKLIATLSRYRKPLTWGLGIFVVALIATFGYLEIQQRRSEAALARIEEAEELYESWVDALESEDDELSEDLRTQTEEALQDVLRRYPRKYAANRALFLQGQILWELGDWSAAAESFRSTADSFPESHLASVSLYNAATAFEEAGNLEGAVDSLDRLVEEFDGEPTPLVPQAIFSLGRIAENQEDFSQANQHYQQLVADHPGSSWTSLARSRIILLTAEGRIN